MCERAYQIESMTVISTVSRRRSVRRDLRRSRCGDLGGVRAGGLQPGAARLRCGVGRVRTARRWRQRVVTVLRSTSSAVRGRQRRRPRGYTCPETPGREAESAHAPTGPGTRCPGAPESQQHRQAHRMRAERQRTSIRDHPPVAPAERVGILPGPVVGPERAEHLRPPAAKQRVVDHHNDRRTRVSSRSTISRASTSRSDPRPSGDARRTGSTRETTPPQPPRPTSMPTTVRARLRDQPVPAARTTRTSATGETRDGTSPTERQVTGKVATEASANSHQLNSHSERSRKRSTKQKQAQKRKKVTASCNNAFTKAAKSVTLPM